VAGGNNGTEIDDTVSNTWLSPATMAQARAWLGQRYNNYALRNNRLAVFVSGLIL
jgi:hypothetical protein